jgi:hypothetical protein
MNHKLLTVILWLLLVAAAQGARNLVTLDSGDLPYTASSNDSIVINGTHITSDGSGIYVPDYVDSVYFDFGTDTLEFGANSGDQEYGIRFNRATDCIINGGTIMRSIGPGPTDGSDNRCLYFTSYTARITFNNTDLIIDGHDAHAVLIYGPVTDLVFNGGTWRSDSQSFTSRHNYDGAVAWFGTPYSGGPSGQYDYSLYGVTIENGPAQGAIFINAKVNVDSCNFSTDHINIGVPTQNANQYLILLAKCKAGTRIVNNTLTSGSSRGGSRGIMIENSNGSSGSHILVRNNTLDVHNGPDAEAAPGSLRAIRLRSIDGNTVSWVDIFSNTVYTTADTNDATTHIGEEAIGLDIKMFSSTSSPAHHIRVDSNTVYARCLSQGTLSKAASPITYGTVDTSGLSFSHNDLYFCDHGLHLSDEGNGIASRDMLYDSNTVTVMDTTVATGNDSLVLDSDIETWHIGVSGGDQLPTATGNVALDNTYTNGAAANDITFNPGAPGPGDLTVKHTLTVLVKDSDSLAIPSADVWAINNYGDTVLTGQTDGNGKIAGAVTWWYDHSTGTDSTAFNDFTLKTRKLTDSTSTTETINDSTPDIILILAASEGEATPPTPGVSQKVIVSGKTRVKR